MLLNPELGYTPSNLRRLLAESNLTQKEARQAIGKERNTFSRYLYDPSNKNHVSMSYVHWVELVAYAQQKALKKGG